MGLRDGDDQSQTPTGWFPMVLLHCHPVFLAGGGLVLPCSSVLGHQSLGAFPFSYFFLAQLYRDQSVLLIFR